MAAVRDDHMTILLHKGTLLVFLDLKSNPFLHKGRGILSSYASHTSYGRHWTVLYTALNVNTALTGFELPSIHGVCR